MRPLRATKPNGLRQGKTGEEEEEEEEEEEDECERGEPVHGEPPPRVGADVSRRSPAAGQVAARGNLCARRSVAARASPEEEEDGERRSRGRRRSGNANYVQATCLGSREIGPVPWNSKLGCHCLVGLDPF